MYVCRKYVSYNNGKNQVANDEMQFLDFCHIFFTPGLANIATALLEMFLACTSNDISQRAFHKVDFIP